MTAGEALFRAVDGRHAPDMAVQRPVDIVVVAFRVFGTRRFAQPLPERQSRFLHQVFGVVRLAAACAAAEAENQKQQTALVLVEKRPFFGR